MKKLLLFIIGILLAFSAYGQSNLPPCQGSDVTKWSNCFGTATWPNGDKYVGAYKDGNINGQGTYTFANGEKHVGDHKDGKPNGQGTRTFANGDKYVGEWRDGKYHGQGTATYADGRVQEGIWADNQFVRAEKINPPSQQTDLALNEERRRLEADRQAVAEDRRRLDEERRNREQVEKLNKTQTDNKPSQTSDTRRRLALVIGNGNYASLSKLPNAINDERSIAQSLQAAGFKVLAYENLDLAGMQNAIRSFGERLGKSDVGLVYFAGHGVQVKGKNYLIPVKENIKKSFEVPANAIDVDLLLATLENVKNDLNIIILDACRSPFPGESRGVTRGLATMDAAKGTFLAFATSPGKEALDGDGANSPYTKHLSRMLSRKGLPLEQVFKEVRKAVVAETNGQQVPWENSSLMGDFYFAQ